MPILLLIADDHAFVREGLRITFEGTDIETVAEASNGQEALDALRAYPVDVALVDIQMPEINGFQFLRLVREAGLTTPVVMHSAHAGASIVAVSRDLGACGFVEKGCDLEVLFDAIRSAAAGRPAWGAQSDADEDGTTGSNGKRIP